MEVRREGKLVGRSEIDVKLDELQARLAAVEQLPKDLRIELTTIPPYEPEGGSHTRAGIEGKVGGTYQAEFDRAEADHERTESQAELAKNDAERAKRLIATKAISEEDYDTKIRTYASARAGVKSAKSALDSARLNLEFTEIHAPIDGLGKIEPRPTPRS